MQKQRDLPQTGGGPSANGRICLATLATSDVPPRLEHVGFASLREPHPRDLHERNMSDLPRFASHIRETSTKGTCRICLAALGTSDVPPRKEHVGFASLREPHPRDLHDQTKVVGQARHSFRVRILTRASSRRIHAQKKCPSRRDGHFRLILVEVVGFEPATPCLQSMCSTS